MYLFQDVEAKAKKDELADVREAIKTKGDIFDNARNQARGLANDVKGKSSSLDKEKETLGNLEVRIFGTSTAKSSFTKLLCLLFPQENGDV